MFLPRYHRSAMDELDDPVAVYEHLIVRNRLSDTHYAIKLLEEVSMKYRYDERYHNSPHYIRLWIIYLSYVNIQYRLPILYWLLVNHIGDKLSILYEEIAILFMQEKRIEQAEFTLLLGISNNAQPSPRLRRAYIQFKLYHTLPTINHLHNLTHDPTLKIYIGDHSSYVARLLGHYARISILRQCYANHQELSFEEIRARLPVYKDNDRKVTPLSINSNAIDFHLSNQHTHPIIHGIQPLYEHSIIHREGDMSQTPTYPIIYNIESEDNNTEIGTVVLPHTPRFIENRLQELLYQSHASNYHLIHDDTVHINQQLTKRKGKRVITLGEEMYRIIRCLGEGGMAKVYLIQDTQTQSFYGLKVQQPPNPWEYYILQQLATRQHDSPVMSRLPVYHFYHYTDRSFIVTTYLKHGTLLDTLNKYRTNNRLSSSGAIPEPLVVVLALQLLKEVHGLHSLGICHNDLKLDNIMMLMDDTPRLILIDYGYSVDLLSLNYPRCRATWPPGCPQSDYPFLNQSHIPTHADYWQIAASIHLLLFNHIMSVSNVNQRYVIQHSLKRYWQKHLWTSFFDVLLNAHLHSYSLQYLIDEFEKYQLPDRGLHLKI
ncbi:kinase-like domain-containing protein [Pilobolus umbonatus]|nr:kinase-like domain-containing protein [Pilobolus umbonatus]